METESVSENCL